MKICKVCRQSPCTCGKKKGDQAVKMGAPYANRGLKPATGK